MAAHQAPPSLGFSRQEHWSGCHFLLQCLEVKSESEVAQSCPTLSDPMDCSLPGSSIRGIFQARVLEWGAIAFSDVCHRRSTNWQISNRNCNMQRTVWLSERHSYYLTKELTHWPLKSLGKHRNFSFTSRVKKSLKRCKIVTNIIFFLFKKNFWNIVDLQCCVNFNVQQSGLYTHIHSILFHILSHYGLS